MNLTRILRKLDSRLGNRFIMILIVITAVFTLAGGIWLAVLMRPQNLPAQTAHKGDCASCHAKTYADWHKGAHGDAQAKNSLAQGTNCLACHKQSPVMVDASTKVDGAAPSFKDFWVKEGMPNNCLDCHVTGYDKVTNTWKSDGIACQACHGIIPQNHPEAVVSVNKSEDTCRACHTDNRFDWGKWKDSVHFKNSITCVDCHNPHTTSLKSSGTTQASYSELCASCHKKLADTSEHSSHKEIGVTCIDCHLGDPKGNDDFHKLPDHDFNAKIETCNKCHVDQMHFAGKPKVTNKLGAFVRIGAKVSNRPASPIESYSYLFTSFFGFIVMAVLFGVVGGVLLRKSVSS